MAEVLVGDYSVSDDQNRLDSRAIHAYLTRAYWSEGIPLATVERALAGSFCVGAYTRSWDQVGLVRIVTDSATFAYICDVYVLEDHRSRGLSKAMMAFVDQHPQLQGLRRWNLVTRDAHQLYARYGFKPAAAPDRYMERLTPNIYLNRQSQPG